MSVVRKIIRQVFFSHGATKTSGIKKSVPFSSTYISWCFSLTNTFYSCAQAKRHRACLCMSKCVICVYCGRLGGRNIAKKISLTWSSKLLWSIWQINNPHRRSKHSHGYVVITRLDCTGQIRHQATIVCIHNNQNSLNFTQAIVGVK